MAIALAAGMPPSGHLSPFGRLTKTIMRGHSSSQDVSRCNAAPRARLERPRGGASDGPILSSPCRRTRAHQARCCFDGLNGGKRERGGGESEPAVTAFEEFGWEAGLAERPRAPAPHLNSGRACLGPDPCSSSVRDEEQGATTRRGEEEEEQEEEEDGGRCSKRMEEGERMGRGRGAKADESTCAIWAKLK